MNDPVSRQEARQGPLKPAAEIGEVRVADPPHETLVMTPQEADVSAIRLMDAADKARRGLTDPDLLKDK